MVEVLKTSVHLKTFLLLITLCFGCDSKKGPSENLAINSLCYIYASCNGQTNSRVGMVGDSWTDLLFGLPAVETLRIQLQKYHGYEITGATLGGQTLNVALNQGLHIQTINEAGPGVTTILLSLGGNDLQANLSQYVGNVDSTKQARFANIRQNLKTLILTGNEYKISRFGGAPLRWIIHGYDYSNPDKGAVIPGSDEGCVSKFTAAGFSAVGLNTFTGNLLNDYNEFLRSMTREEPNFYYVDLRRTLGGPPISRADLMLDCIHPNDLGFRSLGTKYANSIGPFVVR